MRFIQSKVEPALDLLVSENQQFPLVIADPAYGNITKEKWDEVSCAKGYSTWMTTIMAVLERLCQAGAACYWWGGTGKPNDRPFYRFLIKVEERTNWKLAAHLTWKKKRAYGVRTNYLFTREECAFFILGDPKKPLIFNVPYLDKLRGYAGYNPDFPALDARLRRTMVWDDITEVLKGKKHPCEKPAALSRVMIETSSNPGDKVLDLFCGCANASFEAERLGRLAVAIDQDPIPTEPIKTPKSKKAVQ